MGSFFNPANPHYRRAVKLISVYVSVIVGTAVVMGDFGTQEHIFSPIQRYVNGKVDRLFEVEEIDFEVATAKRDKARDDLMIFNAEMIRPLGRPQGKSPNE